MNDSDYEIEVIPGQCIGAASCVAIAPGTFALDDQNISIVTSQTGDAPDVQLSAAKACPVGAIVIRSKSTGKQVWPPEE